MYNFWVTSSDFIFSHCKWYVNGLKTTQSTTDDSKKSSTYQQVIKCNKFIFFLFVIPKPAAFSFHPLCSYVFEKQVLSIYHMSTVHHTSWKNPTWHCIWGREAKRKYMCYFFFHFYVKQIIIFGNTGYKTVRHGSHLQGVDDLISEMKCNLL